MGRRFVFELQAVLDQRERVEDEHRRRVAGIERERVAVEDRLRALQHQILGAKQALRDRLTSTDGGSASVPVSEVRLQATASSQLLLRAQQAVLELAGIHRRLETARRELAAAAAARKAVELLRTRRFEEWKRALAKAEQAELDELAVMRAGRAREAV